MKSIAITLGLFIIGMIAVVTLGDRFLKEEHGVAQASTLPARAKAEVPTIVTTVVPEASSAPSEPSDYAKACAAFDPISHPEQAADILLYARVTGTDAGALYAVWQNETGNMDGAGILSGSYPAMPELARRCQARSAGGCRIGEDGRPTDCADANSCHYFAMERMAPIFGWDLEHMTCSKPTNPATGYGGSCGPFQFSGAEIDDEYAIPLHLDPMTFCGGALIAGWELKKHHDLALAKGLARDDDDAWLWAMDRYLGNFDGHYSGAAKANWQKFKDAYDADPTGLSAVRKLVADNPRTRWNVQYLKQYAANRPAFASN